MPRTTKPKKEREAERARLLDYLRSVPPRTAQEVADAMGWSYQMAHDRLRQAAHAGLVQRTGQIEGTPRPRSLWGVVHAA